MKKIVLEDIKRIHEIMGISGKKLLMEGLPPVFDNLLKSSVIGTRAAFNAAYSLVDSKAFADLRIQIKNLSDELHQTTEGMVVHNALIRLSSKEGKSTDELLYLAMRNEDDLKKLTDEIAFFEAKTKIKNPNYRVVGGLSDLVDEASSTYRAELRNAVDELEYLKNQMKTRPVNDLDSISNSLKNQVQAEPSISQKTKDFYKQSLDEIVQDLKTKNQPNNNNVDVPVPNPAVINGDDAVRVDLPENDIMEYLTANYPRFKKLSPQKQKELFDEYVAILTRLTRPKIELRSSSPSVEGMVTFFNRTDIPPSLKKKILKDALKNANPSLGFWQDKLDWVVNWFVGYNFRTRQWITENGNFKQVLLNWTIANAIYASIASFWSFVESKEKNPDELGKDALQRFLNQYDVLGFMLRILPIPVIARYVIIEIVKAGIDYKPPRQPSSEEVNKGGFGDGIYIEKDITKRDDYNEKQSMLQGWKGKAVSLSKDVRGPVPGQKEDLGVWYYDQQEEKLVAVFNPKSLSGGSTTTIEYGQSLDEFKRFLKDKNLNDSDALNDTDKSGFWKANGKNYQFKVTNTSNGNGTYE
jgi:hypothetical protein